MNAPWKGRSEQECLWCHQTFIPRTHKQRYCSSLCQRGAALRRISESARNSADANAKRARAQRALVESGQHHWARRSEASRQAPEEPIVLRPEAALVPGELETIREPLAFPLVGVDARAEWLLLGDLRQAQADAALRSEETRTTEGRTVVLAGQGSYLGVEAGALILHQGRTHGVPAPERERLYPAMHGVRRILWIGAHGHLTGTLTLAAAAWLQREGIHLCVLDSAGFPLVELAPTSAPQDSALRRRQWLLSSGARLPDTPDAPTIVREIVRRKVEGQQRTLHAHADLPGQAHALDVFQRHLAWLRLEPPPNIQRSITYLRTLEGRIAMAYFRAIEGWPLRWSKTDLRRVPPHWLSARARVSPLSSSNNARHAVDPLNACLNYAYACLASQCRQALLGEGLDPMCGFLHADKPGRDSLTYDLMELERGAVDDLLLTFLGKTTLHYGDFARAVDGAITLHPQLTRLLLAHVRVPQARLNGHARWLRLLFSGMKGDVSRAPEVSREDDG
jgi:CRISPR-associated endonuclease Cas1